jgi:hypothetical protein
VNAWQALSEIFTNMLRDPKLRDVCLLVDALDECVGDRERLLDLIVWTSKFTTAKWLVSSRNWLQIEEKLRNVAQRLSLELNADSVSAAVDKYITSMVSRLSEHKGYSEGVAEEIRQYLSLNADGTFLWVALVCQELGNARKWNTLEKLKSFPPGLDSFYDQMMQQIRDSDDAEICKQVLALTATTYRPPSLAESTILIEECYNLVDDSESLQEIISLCGSFLTVRDDTVYFVHQSAKDFLVTKQSTTLFPRSQAAVHGQIFCRSIQAMSHILRRDIYNLSDLGVHINNVRRPTPDPLALIGYSCLSWVHHLVDSDITPDSDDVQDSRTIHEFLESKCLYWIESLSLLRAISEGMLAVESLRQFVQVSA